MAIFDYKAYSSEESAELTKLSLRLANFGMIPDPAEDDLTFDILSYQGDGSMNGGLSPQDLPDDWRVLKAAELGLSEDVIDSEGYIKIESPLTGWTEGGPQAKVMAQYDDSGAIIGLSISYAGTNSIVDAIDFTQLNSGEMGEMLEPLLSAVRDVAVDAGLDASDVLITGYSLGGAMTNLQARYADTLADGFFADSNYIAHESPLIWEDPERVLNIGYENDVVFRAAGDFETVEEALVEGGPLFEGSDFNLETTTNNIVNFDGSYASPLWPFGPFSLLNFVGGWWAHAAGCYSTTLERITQSEFYDLTEKDSVIVVSDLGADLRWFNWVWDKPSASHDREYSPSIVIGTNWDDMLKDNTENDYLEGRAGDDLLRVTDGNNRVSGGEGTDTLRLEGFHSNWTVYRMTDGTLFVDKSDGSSLNEATGIERVAFEGGLGELAPEVWDYSVQSDRLEDEHWSLFEWGDNDVAYSQAAEGTADDDVLSGSAVFGRAGNDVITGTEDADVLHGGEGDDVLIGRLGDRLYGAEGDDVLVAETGDVQFNGGWGADTFVLKEGVSGEVTIADFDALATGDDVLALSSSQFGNADEVLSSLSQCGSDVLLCAEDITVRLSHTDIADFAVDDFLFV